jgi:hypothetical protein
MPRAKLLFFSQANSFKVTVKNLEELSIEQIQQLEKFVQERKGIFDFTTYTFTIQKRIEYEEFVKLILLCDIKADVEEYFSRKTEERVSFGHYKGMEYKHLPDSYLLWLKVNYHGADKKIINREIKRRKL